MFCFCLDVDDSDSMTSIATTDTRLERDVRAELNLSEATGRGGTSTAGGVRLPGSRSKGQKKKKKKKDTLPISDGEPRYRIKLVFNVFRICFQKSNTL